ncbi:MAG: trimethylamine methyltransferase family protein [Terriglobales bacterium]
MRPTLALLDRPLLDRILEEAFVLLMNPGVQVATLEATQLLTSAGAEVEDGVAHIPESLARRALESTPREFYLYDRAGQPAVHYGGDDVHFDPGSSCLNILDPDTLQPRLAQSADLVRLIQATEMLSQYAAQSTAVVCNDVPSEIGDIYRLFLVLWHSNKPVVTGAFSAATLQGMIDLLAADSGSSEALKRKPRAVFDVCPSPPLNWTEFAAYNLVELARAGIPAELISMPLAGATGPVTLAGSVVQHAAESISGITIHQLASPGAPIVWGGAPAIFDMSTGGAPMGAIETAMLDIACTQVGKHLGLPTHAYLVASDSKLVDAQAGMESSISAVLGALAGINMISGAGMLDSLACHSVEKLVIDAEAIASAQRLVAGIEARTEKLALSMFEQVGLNGEFLKLKETRALFRSEQHFPSGIIDRRAREEGDNGPSRDTFCRARARVNELLASYRGPVLSPEVKEGLVAVASREGKRVGLEDLPGI